MAMFYTQINLILALCLAFFFPFRTNSHQYSSFNTRNEISYSQYQSIFFPNYCTTADGTDGICYGEVTCKRMYGKVSGYCGTYHGACCIFNRQCNGLTSQETSYFRNTRWPRTQRLSRSCPVTIRKPNSHYCGLRLELSHVRLPNKVGSCSDTYLSITGIPGRTIFICGKFGGKTYEFNTAKAGDIRINMLSYSSFRTSWKIKVHQIMCQSFNGEKIPQYGDGSSVKAKPIKTKPTKPSKPSKPTKPSKPSKPSKPTKPSKLTKPTKPIKPTKPSKPTKPTKPTKPGNGNYVACGKSSKLISSPWVNFRWTDFQNSREQATSSKIIEMDSPYLAESYFYQYTYSFPVPLLTQRITYGSVSEEGKYPWQVALFTGRGRFHCGGTLLSNYHVLTAAHCVVRKQPRELTVVLGSFDLSNKDYNPKTVKLSLQTIWVHNQYSSYNLRNDIAVIKLARSVRYTSEIGPACLPNRSKYLTKQIATVTGWGKNEKGHLVSKLHELKAEILDNDVCERRWNPGFVTGSNNFIVDSMICMNPQHGDSCNGDSGGPLIMERPGSRGTYEVIGIVSFGSGSCTDPNLPGVYTRVSKYIGWIARHLKY